MKNVFRIIIALSLISNWVLAAPTDINKSVDSFINSLRGESKKAALANPYYKEQLVKYIHFLQLRNDSDLKKVFSILANSSTEFMLCNPEDWECIEKDATVPAASDSRKDFIPGLGKPEIVNEDLSMEYFFTKHWAQIERGEQQNTVSLAQTFAEKIDKHAINGLYMAIYGMDESEGSMKPVYEIIQKKLYAGVETKAVVDVTSENSPNAFLRDYDVVLGEKGKVDFTYYSLSDLDFSYLLPKSGEHMWVWGRPNWMDKTVGMDPNLFLGNKGDKTTLEQKDAAWIAKMPGGKTAKRIAFQYKDSPRLIQMLNSGIEDSQQARARIEYPFTGIMHNKFAIMKDGNNLSVWSGTTNVADTCMGSENNANMAILIHNNAVANSYLSEFNEMYNFDPTNKKLTDKVPTLVTGRFHDAKRPVAKRYFKFKDGTELRIHFAPTDDGEHRAILPLIHSAKSGDTLRISMFGSGGIEGVRALQAAAARGVKIFIVLDNTTGSGNFSWIKNLQGNLLDPNPYASEVQYPIEIRLSNWNGLNHHKTATLTRADGRVEYFSIGSQNWSRAGNDINDENMITMRKLGKSIEAGEAFNKEFDQNIRPLSLMIKLDENGKVVKIGKEKKVTIKVDEVDPDSENSDNESDTHEDGDAGKVKEADARAKAS